MRKFDLFRPLTSLCASALDLALLAQGAGSHLPPAWAIVVGVILAVLALIAAGLGVSKALIERGTARITNREHAPPDEGADRPRAELLPPRSHFVNREIELQEAAHRIKTGEIVLVIEGDVGVGKSAVAAELVHRLHEQRLAPDEMPDLSKHAFVWLNAEHRCPSLTAICQALGLLTGDQSLTTAPRRNKLAALQAHLARNKTVLFLDDVTLSDDPRSDALRAFLRTVPGGSLVIASVRRPATLDASRVQVGELATAHVLELVHHEARQLGLEEANDFDETFVRRLEAAIGGNPKLIAWFLRAFESSPDALEERLEAVERGERLSEFLAPIWQDLDEPAREVLAACAYLRGEANREQLITACSMGERDVVSALAGLMRHGLVVTVRATGRPPVYTCAAALRTYIRTVTSTELADAFTTRLARRYIDRFASDWEDARGAIPHIGAFLVVLDELFARGDDQALQALFAAVLDILFTLGLFDARISTGTLAYSSAVRAENHRAASLASSVVSSTHAIRGELANAREAVALGLVAAEASNDASEVARQQRCLGFVRYRDRDPVAALDAIEGAEQLARRGGDVRGLVDILGLRTAAHWYLGAVDDAEHAAEACLVVCNSIPWERGRAYPLRDLAEIAIHRGQLERARELLDAGRRAAAGADDRRQLARMDLTEARLLLVERRTRAAVAAAARAEAASRQLGLPPEAEEARAVRVVATRATVFPPLRFYHARRRRTRFSDAPVAGD